MCKNSTDNEIFRAKNHKKEPSSPNKRTELACKCVHRAHILEELVKAIPPQCAHFGKRPTQIEERRVRPGDKIILHFKNKTSASVDAVAGADGIHSQVRLHILGEDHPAARAAFAGSATYIGLVTMDRAVENLGDEYAQNSMMLCGPGRALLSYPIEHGKLLNIVLMDYEQEQWEHEKWIVPKTRTDLDKTLDRWGPTAQKLIDVC
jgi:salicylate hydroxylase